jgi:uncharacterized protein YuzE
MGRVKQWLSSKLSTEAGTYEQADPYAEIAESDYYMVSQAVPSPSYLEINKTPGTFVHKTVCYGNYDEVLIDFDKDGNVIGVELLADSVLTYDEKREA